MTGERPENATGSGEFSPFVFTIEVGADLSYLLKNADTPAFVPSINRLREELSREWGLRLPPFLIRESRSLEPESYRFFLFSKEIANRRVYPGKTLIITGKDELARIPGETDLDPIYNRPCVWVDPGDSAYYAGAEPYSATAGEVIVDHLQAVLRSNAAEFITTQVVKEKLETLHMVEPAIVKKTLRKLTLAGLVRVMKNLVPEGIPLTEIESVVRTVAETDLPGKDPDRAAEMVRSVMKNNIHNHAFRDRLLLFAIPDSRIQLWLYKRAGKSMRVPEGDPVAEFIVRELTSLHLSFLGKGFRLGIICSSPVRLILRRILEKKIPDVVVLKPAEIDPGRDVMIVRKLRLKGLRLWLAWHWFWVTAAPAEREEFRRELQLFLEFLNNRRKEAPLPAPPQVPPAPLRTIFYRGSLEHLSNSNLPAPITINRRQKAAIILMGSDDSFLKEVFSMLNPREVISIAMEMANLPRDSGELREDMVGEIYGGAGRLHPESMANYIKASMSREEVKLNISPLQKMAVIISSLPPRTAETMYKRILADMSSRELEGLAMAAGRNQIISLQETRGLILDDFFWFLKGRCQMGVLYTSGYWVGELQRISIRSPRRFAAALKELWLSPGFMQDRFDRFVRHSPADASFWIRRYISSRRDVEIDMRLAEKAFIIIQLLPGELAQDMIRRLGGMWNRIFQNTPRFPGGPDPSRAGVVITQFLSHYYSAYDKNWASRIQEN